MRGNRIPAMILAMVIGMASANLGAETLLPHGSPIGVVAKFSTGVSKMVNELEASHAARSLLNPSVQTFAGPYRLMVSRAGAWDLSQMVLASLGLMAMIAYRRRSI